MEWQVQVVENEYSFFWICLPSGSGLAFYYDKDEYDLKTERFMVHPRHAPIARDWKLLKTDADKVCVRDAVFITLSQQ